MSRKIPREKYERTFSYRMKQWLAGTRDPFVNTVEMKPQKEFQEDQQTVRTRTEEKKKAF